MSFVYYFRVLVSFVYYDKGSSVIRILPIMVLVSFAYYFRVLVSFVYYDKGSSVIRILLQGSSVIRILR